MPGHVDPGTPELRRPRVQRFRRAVPGGEGKNVVRAFPVLPDRVPQPDGEQTAHVDGQVRAAGGRGPAAGRVQPLRGRQRRVPRVRQGHGRHAGRGARVRERVRRRAPGHGRRGRVHAPDGRPLAERGHRAEVRPEHARGGSRVLDAVDVGVGRGAHVAGRRRACARWPKRRRRRRRRRAARRVLSGTGDGRASERSGDLEIEILLEMLLSPPPSVIHFTLRHSSRPPSLGNHTLHYSSRPPFPWEFNQISVRGGPVAFSKLHNFFERFTTKERLSGMFANDGISR